jgi:hypothetical protein
MSDQLDPIFVSVKEAAKALSVPPGAMYDLLNSGQVAGRYKGRKRLVVVKSLREYAASLPEYPEAS